jgi:hypothetical protein
MDRHATLDRRIFLKRLTGAGAGLFVLACQQGPAAAPKPAAEPTQPAAAPAGQDPKVLLLDEPFGALDALTREELQALVVELWQQTRKTILYVTHNLSEAVYLSDRTIVLTSQRGLIKADVRILLQRARDAINVVFIEHQRRLTELIVQN